MDGIDGIVDQVVAVEREGKQFPPFREFPGGEFKGEALAVGDLFELDDGGVVVPPLIFSVVGGFLDVLDVGPSKVQKGLHLDLERGSVVSLDTLGSRDGVFALEEDCRTLVLPFHVNPPKVGRHAWPHWLPHRLANRHTHLPTHLAHV